MLAQEMYKSSSNITPSTDIACDHCEHAVMVVGTTNHTWFLEVYSNDPSLGN